MIFRQLLQRRGQLRLQRERWAKEICVIIIHIFISTWWRHFHLWLSGTYEAIGLIINITLIIMSTPSQEHMQLRAMRRRTESWRGSPPSTRGSRHRPWSGGCFFCSVPAFFLFSCQITQYSTRPTKLGKKKDDMSFDDVSIQKLERLTFLSGWRRWRCDKSVLKRSPSS